ncbi:MAG TPA: TolC family protein [Opitutaceae bacterium]|nr:TolC family protein [Opitutaceae bacterium]
MKTCLYLSLAWLAAIWPARTASADDAPTASGPLTLRATVEAVLARYPSIDAANAAIEAAQARTEQSRSARLPQLGASAGYQFLSPRISISFGPTSFYQNAQDNYDARLTLHQLVTDFGRTQAAVSAARAGEHSAADTLEQTRNQLGYAAIQEFYAVILLRQSVAVADEEIHALQEALRIAQNKLANGTATKFDVLTTQVRLANAENNRTTTVASLQKQEALLRQLLGREAAAPLDLTGEFETQPGLPDLSATLAEALQRRPEIRLAHDTEESARFRLDAAEAADRPTLAADVAGGLHNGTLPNLYDNKGYVAAGLSVSVPLFTGHRTEGERREARADLRAAQARASEATRTVTGEIETALADLAASEARVANADTLVAQAEEALALARTRYENGVITNFELLDAQSSARAAELARLQARYDCVLDRYALAKAAGRPPLE